MPDKSESEPQNFTHGAAPVFGFRLPEVYRKMLERQASVAGETTSAFARKLVIDALEGNTPPSPTVQFADELVNQVSRIERALKTQRADLALVAVALLVKAGRCTNDEATDWCFECLGLDPFEDREDDS